MFRCRPINVSLESRFNAAQDRYFCRRLGDAAILETGEPEVLCRTEVNSLPPQTSFGLSKASKPDGVFQGQRTYAMVESGDYDSE